MDNILELLTKRVERELNATKCVVDIFKVQNLKKLKRKDGTYWHNGISITMSDTSQVSIRGDFTCIGCNMKASYVVIAKNVHTSSANQKYIPFYYIVDYKNGELKKLTKDHIIPRSLGGSNNMSNYQCMCEVCNGKKSNFLYGFDVDGLVNERIAEEQNRIMADIIAEFEKAPFIMKLFGLSKFVNKIIDKVVRK